MKKIYLFSLFFLFYISNVLAQEFLKKYDFNVAFCTSINTTYIVGLNNKYGVLNYKGENLIPIEFDLIEKYSIKCSDPISNFIFKVMQGGQIGLMSSNGMNILPFGNWERIELLNNNLVTAQNINKNRDLIYFERHDTTFIFKNGKEIFKTYDYYDFSSYSPSNVASKLLSAYCNCGYNFEREYDYGIMSYFIIDHLNSVKLKFKNSKLDLWPNNILLVTEFPDIENNVAFDFYKHNLNTTSYLANLNGEKITKKGIYSKIYSFETYPKFQAVSKNDGLTYLIDSAGNKLSVGYNSSYISEKQDYYFFKLYNKYSTIPIRPIHHPKIIESKSDLERNKTLPKINKIFKFEDLYMQIYKSDSTALIDFNGNLVTNWYKHLFNFNYNFQNQNNKIVPVYIGMNSNKNVLLHLGKLKEEIPIPFFDNIDFSYPHLFEGLYAIKVNNFKGLLNSSLKVELPPNFDDILPFNENYLKLISNGKFGLFNIKNKNIINPIYDNIDDYPIRVKLNGTWGKIVNSTFIPF